MILFMKVLVVFVRLFPELFVEACPRVWLLLRKSRFDGGGQVSRNLCITLGKTCGRFEGTSPWATLMSLFKLRHPDSDTGSITCRDGFRYCESLCVIVIVDEAFKVVATE